MNKIFRFGNQIKGLHTERSLSLERFALNARITPIYLGLAEHGKRNATVTTIDRICTALSISPAEFFSVADPFFPVDDDIGKQILHQLSGLSDEENRGNSPLGDLSRTKQSAPWQAKLGHEALLLSSHVL